MKDPSRANQKLIEELSVLKKKIEKLEKSGSRQTPSEMELRNSEHKYRQLAEDMPALICTFLPDSTLTYVNKAYCELFQMRPDDLVGQKFLDFLPNEATRENVRRQYMSLTPENPVQTYEHEVIVSDGTNQYHWYRWTDRAFFSDNGQISHFQSIGQDITERKRAEEALRESEGKYRSLIENIYDGIYILDSSEKFTFVNDVIEERFGYPAEWFLGRGYLSVISENDRERVQRHFNAVMEGKTQIYDLSYSNKSGNLIHVEVSTAPLYDGAKVIGLLGISRDITDRKSMERALAEEHHRLSSILDASPVSSFVIDLEHRVTAWNMVNEFFTGISKEDILGKPLDLSPLFKNKVSPALADLVLEMTDAEIMKRYGDKGIRKSEIHPQAIESIGSIWIKGKEHIMAVQATRLRDASGNVIGAIQCAQDITEQQRLEETLKLSEKKYRDFFNRVPVALFQSSLEGRYLSANDNLAKTLGYDSPEDLIQSITDIGTQIFANPEGRSEVMRLLQENGFLEDFEVECRHKDGHSAWGSLNIRIVRDANGNPLYIDGSSQEITKRKQAEEEIRRGNMLLSAIVENIPNTIFLKDAKDLRFVLFNRAGEDLTGYSRADLLGKNDYDFAPKEQADFFAEKDREVLRGKDVVDIPEEPLQTRNKGGRILHTKKVPIVNANGEPEYLLGISEDITDRKRIEEILKKSEEKYRVLLENASDAILITDIDGNIIQANRKAEEFLGYTEEDLLQMNYTQIHTKHELERTTEAFKEIINNGHGFLHDGRILRKDEKEVPVDINVVVIEYAGQKVVQGSFRDITEQKNAKDTLERQVKERTAEIAKKNRQLAGEIKKHKTTEAELLRKEKELQLYSTKLQQLNAALKVLLKQREDDRRDLEEKVLSNVKHLINPNLETLKKRKLDPDSKIYVDILEQNLKNIISPFSHTLSSKYQNLTPTEIKVADMIRNGKATKEMAEFMGVSESAINHHRHHIRNKLGILTQKINLRSHLLSLS